MHDVVSEVLELVLSDHQVVKENSRIRQEAFQSEFAPLVGFEVQKYVNDKYGCHQFI